MHSLGTTAIGNVVKDLTNRIGATNSGTGIDTLVADTSSASIAVRVQNTLGTAAGVRVTVIFRQTRTYSVVALGVGATRRGVTRVLWRQWILDFCWWFGIADAKRITDVAHQTTADGSVVDDIALGVEATGSGARIEALLINARLVARALSVNGALWTTVGWCTHELGQT